MLDLEVPIFAMQCFLLLYFYYISLFTFCEVYQLWTDKYFLYINCGGEDVVINNNTRFEADVEFRGASMFYSRQNWAFSSTGIFMDNDLDADAYITTNTSALKNVSASLLNLYKTARTSPVSLTYYGLCLGNGNYTVSLHFAEIVFTNDRSFNSLGKRIFDVYIQVIKIFLCREYK